MLDGFTQLALAVAKIDTSSAATIDWTRYVMACVGIASLLGLGAVGLRRFAKGNWNPRQSKRELRVVDALSIGRKQRLIVVRCYDRTFALGVGEREVSLLAEFDAEVSPAPSAAPAVEKAAGKGAGFSDLLARIGAELGPAATSASADRVRAREAAKRGDLKPADSQRDSHREVVRRAAERAAARVTRAGRAAVAKKVPRQAMPVAEQPAAALPNKGTAGTIADALRGGGLLG